MPFTSVLLELQINFTSMWPGQIQKLDGDPGLSTGYQEPWTPLPSSQKGAKSFYLHSGD